MPSGGNAAFEWAGLDPSRSHEWYVSVSDGQAARTGPAWTFTTGTATGVGDVAGDLALAPPSPNPARSALRFSFDLPRAMRARLDLVDVQGRIVAVLADGDFAAGRHVRAWDAVTGGPVGAGLYFVRLRTEAGCRVQRTVRFR